MFSSAEYLSSDAYMVEGDRPNLELEVKVININPEENHELLEKCPVLKEYGQFVSLVRKFQREGDSDPCKHAVEECIRQGILSDYLRKKGSEVFNMLIAEYDYDLDIEVQREEAFEEGIEQGEKKKLISLVCRKIKKGKPAEVIAEELEEEEQVVHEIYEAALEAGPDYDVDMIYKILTHVD